MVKKELPRLAILGAGPIGLEAALCARQHKLPFTLYERGQVGEHLRRWGHVKLFSPFALNATPLGRQALLAVRPADTIPADDALLTGREHVERYLVPIAEVLKPQLRTETQILHIGRRGFLRTEAVGDPARARQPFLVLTRDKTTERIEEADVILDCTGTYGQHRWLGSGGIPALGEMAAQAQIAYGLEDLLGERKKDYVNRSLLIVGSGYSAATTACLLSQIADADNATWITWIARSSHSQPLRRLANDPLRERDRIAQKANSLATRTDDNVEYHPATIVEAIEALGPDKGFRVQCRKAGERRNWEVDRILANVGYAPDLSFARELPLTENDLPASVTSKGTDPTRMPEPNYYLLGAKCFGRNAQFLLQQGFEQVRAVFARLVPEKR